MKVDENVLEPHPESHSWKQSVPYAFAEELLEHGEEHLYVPADVVLADSVIFRLTHFLLFRKFCVTFRKISVSAESVFQVGFELNTEFFSQFPVSVLS